MVNRTMLKLSILTPPNLKMKRRFRVTITIDRAIDNGILSMARSCLKKRLLQTKPGRNSIRMEPSIALTTGTLPNNNWTNPNISLKGDNQSTFLSFDFNPVL